MRTPGKLEKAALTAVLYVSVMVICLFSCNLNTLAQAGGMKTQTDLSASTDIADAILQFSPDEYFGGISDFSNREFALLDLPFEGVAINSPSTIDLAGRGTLPLVMAIADTTRRQWEVVRNKNLTLVAMSMDTDTILIHPAIAPPEKEPADEPFSRQPPEPIETQPYTKSVKIEMIEARSRLELPWQPGKYRLAVINFDRVSNAVEVELRGAGKPEEGRVVTSVFSPPGQAAVTLSGKKVSLPNYDILPFTPPLSQDGLAFVLPAETATTTSLPLFGAFNVKAGPGHLNRSGTVQNSEGGKKFPVVGVVPVTLLLFALDGEIPRRFDWAIPVYGSAPPAAGTQLTGSFAVDVLQGSAMQLSPGRYMAYIICNATIYGPREVQR